MAVQIQLRRDTAANWTGVNPILAQGEAGLETDTGKLKFGDGVTHWAGLAYFGGSPSGAAGGNLGGNYPSPTIADVALLTTKGDLLGRGNAAPAARLAVGADGQVLTADAASTLGLKWAAAAGGGAITQLFDSTLGADAAGIDTGANGVPQTANHLLVIGFARTSEAVVSSSVGFVFNNDTTAIYDDQNVRGINGSSSASATAGQTSALFSVPGDTAAATMAGALVLFLPSYLQTTFHHSVFGGEGWADATVANSRAGARAKRYRSTTAISRMAMNAGSGNLRAGSRLTIYGLT